MKITLTRICLSSQKDNPGQNTKGYLLHQIRFKSKHPKVLSMLRYIYFSILAQISNSIYFQVYMRLPCHRRRSGYKQSGR
jgi:hypothetical protein